MVVRPRNRVASWRPRDHAVAQLRDSQQRSPAEWPSARPTGLAIGLTTVTVWPVSQPRGRCAADAREGGREADLGGRLGADCGSGAGRTRGGRRRSRRTLRRAEDGVSVRGGGRKIAVDMERQGQPCLLLTGGRGSGAGHTAAAAGEAAADAACEDVREE